MKFLQEHYAKGLETYFLEILVNLRHEFIPQERKVGARNRDAMKLVVFYDNNVQTDIEPMAICMLLRNNNGLFALTDDFGKVIEGEYFWFKVSGTVFRPIVY